MFHGLTRNPLGQSIDVSGPAIQIRPLTARTGTPSQIINGMIVTVDPRQPFAGEYAGTLQKTRSRNAYCRYVERPGIAVTQYIKRLTLITKCALRRLVTVLPELEDRIRTVGAINDVPGAVGRTEDADISLAVAVKIGRNGNVVR